MTTRMVADRLVELCKSGSFVQAQQELYDTDIVRIEPDGTKTTGAAKMLEQEQRFLASLEKIHNISYSEPLIAGKYFTVVLKMEIDMKQRGHITLEEVCVYEVVNGKVVFEQFFR
jgi:hypothetical protein